jgi:hypothetical protein
MKTLNYKIDNNEKNQILEMHSKMKKPMISEQTTPNVRQQLEKFLSDGCVKNGKIVSIQSKNPLLQLAIKQESTKTPGKFRYVFADNRIGSFNENGKFEFSPSKMSCQAVQQAAAAAVTATQQEEIDSKIATEMKKGWKKLETLKAEKVDLTTLDKVFDKQVIGNVALFRPKGSSTTFTPGTSTSDFNNDQQSFVDTFIAKGYKLNPTRLEQNSLVKVTGEQLGAPADLFPNGLVMWYDPNKQSTISGGENSILSDILDNQSINRTTCRKNVKDFFELYRRRNSTQVDPATVDRAKRIVQACRDEHYGKWGVTGGKNVDDMLDILSGRKEGGPISTGPTSIFRIK